jgi:hypothetical protein
MLCFCIPLLAAITSFAKISHLQQEKNRNYNHTYNWKISIATPLATVKKIVVTSLATEEKHQFNSI